jgi:hypothetical protein
MRLVLRRALQGAGAAALVIAVSASPVSGAVGTRLVNGDGDTAGRCLSIVNAGRGTSVEMEPCNSNAHQGWEYISDGAGGVRIVSQDADARGRCLTAHGEGVRVTMDRCVSRSTHPALYEQQVWLRVVTTGDWRLLANLASWQSPGAEQCLDVRNNGTSNVVQTWLCGPSDLPGRKGNQMWKFG